SNLDIYIEGTVVKGEEVGVIFPDYIFQFTDLSSVDAVSWHWNLCDGSVSDEKYPAHVFGKKGDFDVTLTITNQLGCEATSVKKVSILRSYRVMFPTGFTPLDNENQFFLPK